MSGRKRLLMGLLLGLLGSASLGTARAWDDSAWWDGFVPPGVRGGGPSSGGDINAIVRSGPNIYVGGDFDSAGGVPASNVARWDGTHWHPLGDGLDGIVHALFFWYGDLHAGGEFQNPAPHIAKYWAGEWHQVGVGDFDDVVRCFIDFRGELWVGGDFEKIGDQEIAYMASFDGVDWLDRDGCGADPPWGNASVRSFVVYADTLRIGGTFEQCALVEAPYFAKYWESFGYWKPHDSGEGLNGSVNDFMERDGELWIGGEFGSVNDLPSRGIGLYSSSGFFQVPPGGGADHDILDLEPFGNWFYASTRYGIYPYGTSGPEDPHWLDPLGNLEEIDHSAFELLYWNPDLYAVGSIRDGIARWDGEGWRRLGAGIINEGSGHDVEALCAWNGGIVAGGFMGISSADETATSAYVGFFDGETWFPLANGLSRDVFDLIVFDDDLYACGRFTRNNESPMPAIARWDGSAWHALGSGLSGVSNLAYTLEVFDGQLAVGGSFNVADGVSCPARVALWNGSSFSALGDGMNGPVRDLQAWNGSLVAGGSMSMGGATRFVALWDDATWQPMEWPRSPALSIPAASMTRPRSRAQRATSRGSPGARTAYPET